MSEIRDVIRTKLLTNSTLSAALGSSVLSGMTVGTSYKSIFYDHLPDDSGVVYPVIVMFDVSGTKWPTNVNRIKSSRWQFDIEASTLTTIETIKKLVIDTLDKWTYSDSSYAIKKCLWDNDSKPEYDVDMNLWSVTIEFIIEFQIK